MKLLATAALTLAASAGIAAKSATLLISISGPGIPLPMEIRDPVALRTFTDRVEGFIVDWPAGPVPPSPADGLLAITFRVSPTRAGRARISTVGYLCDRSTRRGRVFLPAVPDAGPGPIHQWFSASAEWDRFVGCSDHGAVMIQDEAGQGTTRAAEQTGTAAPTGFITGRVFDPRGEPLRGSNVRLYRQIYEGGERRFVDVETWATTTDTAGAFRLQVPPGRYYVAALPPRHLIATFGSEQYVTTFHPNSPDPAGAVPVVVTAGSTSDETNVWVATSPAVTVRGRATGPVLPPVLLLTPRGRYSPQIAHIARPGAEASFEMATVPPGRYTLVAASATNLGEVYGWTDVDVRETDLHDVVVPTERLRELAGYVSVIGETGTVAPAAGVRVVLTPEGFANAWSAARSNPDGSFVLKRLRRIPYRLTLQSIPEGTSLWSVTAGGQEVTPASVDVATLGSAPLQITLTRSR